MKKQTLTKIISGLIIFVFVISISQFAIPIQAAAETSISNYYANPNQSGDNTYKFKIKDVVNSNLLTNIVGCTGVVNKVATWMSTMIQSKEQIAKIALEKITKYRNLAKQSCLLEKAGVQLAGGATPLVNDLVTGLSTAMEAADIAGGIGSIGVTKINTTSPDTKTLAGVKPAETAGLSPTEKSCVDNVNVMSDATVTKLADIQKQDQTNNFKTQCFDGIAITLAKNQLSAMTRSAMNWVNSGYGGNPFFVQNMTNLTNNIERNVLNTGIDALLSPLAPQNPYASDFMTSMIKTQGLRSSSTKFLGGLTSDLENFISNPVSYYSDQTLTDAEKTQMALQRSKDANNAFARDFSVGGWNGWLALTQTPQNNPLGFNMITSQYLADVQSQEVSRTQSELTQNNGFLSQKECIKWQIYTADGKPKMQKGVSVGTSGLAQGYVPVYSNTKPSYGAPDNTHEYGKCTPDGWKITTPGSIIRDKTTNYLNSPERQLELAKTINDSLNALFSVLIDKLAGGGLSSLSDSANNSSNWTDTMNNYVSPDGNTPYDNNGAYDGFNLTRDLGNNYIYGELTDLGTWNASTNEATNTTYKELPSTFPAGVKTVKLYPETSPENYEIIKDGTIKLTKDSNGNDQYGELVNPVNAYYKVTTAGNEKLMVEGYNGWAVGDRAFWDGSKWQNWKCYKSTTINKSGACDNQINPIKKRGVIQIQQDYIVAGKEILKVLPSIMPKLGELDYCLPGPNPSYQINSSDAQSAFSSWIGSSFIGPIDSSGKRTGVKIDQSGDRTYENLRNIYSNNTIWKAIVGETPSLYYNNTTADSLATIKFNGYSNDLTMQEIIMFFTNICNDGALEYLGLDGYDSDSCRGNYLYEAYGNGLTNLSFKSNIQEYLNNFVNTYMFDTFYKIFDKEMNDTYFKNMTSKYLDTETSISEPGTENLLAYIPMAAAGFDLTKNITYYNNDIANATSGYVDAMTQAKINIAKLEPIRNEVSGIIKDAQDRRTANLLKTLGKLGNQSKFDNCNQTQKQCLEEVNDSNIGFNAYVTKMNTYACNIDNNICIIDLEGGEEQAKIACQNQRDACDIAFPTDKTGACVSRLISCLDPIKDKIIAKVNKENDAIIAKYKEDSEVCLTEENISFYDPEQITKNGESGSCSDGIDNDLDGLVDKKDWKDCGGVDDTAPRRSVDAGRSPPSESVSESVVDGDSGGSGSRR